jgi:hypothetical protein
MRARKAAKAKRASTRTVGRPRASTKHIASPATASSIREALGIGRHDLDEAKQILQALNLG